MHPAILYVGTLVIGGWLFRVISRRIEARQMDRG